MDSKPIDFTTLSNDVYYYRDKDVLYLNIYEDFKGNVVISHYRRDPSWWYRSSILHTKRNPDSDLTAIIDELIHLYDTITLS